MFSFVSIQRNGENEMLNRFSRTELILGDTNIKKLKNSHVAVFGIGGVGSYAAEALARAGVGSLLLIDNDTICLTNINRQIHAMDSTIGRLKVDVMKERIININPEAEVSVSKEFVTPSNVSALIDSSFSYVIDAIDNVTAKLALIMLCRDLKVPVISSMGTGNKLHPEMLTITDIYKTKVCPLAKVMRKELRNRNVESLKVCCSEEEPLARIGGCLEEAKARPVPGSISFVPPAAGMIIAGEVIRELIGYR